MPCRAGDNTLNPVVLPPQPIPGFGIPFSPIQIPVPNLKLPDGFPQKILDLINQLKVPWPGAIELDPHLDELSNTVLKAISSIFQQMAPFLSLYNFFMALMNLILCIIDVICAIPRPWSMLKAAKRLIKNCLPPFLNLFPWIALLIMILSFLSLLLALIEYIISRLLQLFEDLIKNLELLARGVTLQDAESTAATAVKIASLLCMMEDLFAMFQAIAAIMAIIEALSKIGGRKPCSHGGGSGCCDNDSCPPFLVDNPNGIIGTSGDLYYYKGISGFRNESWQFVNSNQSATWPFNSITTPQVDSDGHSSGAYWPEGVTYTSTTDVNQAPYNLNFTIKNYKPDNKNARNFKVKNTIVTIKPYSGIYTYDNSLNTVINHTGTLNISGGLVYEEDDSPYMINGVQATLNTFIHQNSLSVIPTVLTDDVIKFSNLEFTLNINETSLVGYGLISIGCMSEIRQEMDLLNSTFDPNSAFAKSGPFPDISGAQLCLSSTMSSLRKNLSPSNAASTQAQILGCLTNLREQTLSTICQTFNSTVDIYKTQVTLEPDIAFTTRKIKVNIDLQDSNGNSINSLLPPECFGQMSNLTGEVTLGEISEFTIEPDTKIPIAYISSDKAGDGTLKVTWNGNYISTILNRDDNNIPTSIEILELPYSFVEVSVGEDTPRRDASDAARVE
jgi:hypothetical protein